MARTKPSQQLSQDEIDRFLVAAEALHKSIVAPLLAYNSKHYRALREVHEPLLKSIETITGKPSLSNGAGLGRRGRLRTGSSEILSETRSRGRLAEKRPPSLGSRRAKPIR